MKTLWIALIIVALLIVGGIFLLTSKEQAQETGGAQQTSTGQQTTNNVEINNFAFSPSEIRIKQGETITWKNLDSAKHTVTSDSGSELNSELLSKGQTYSHTFNTAGIFEYHCTPHPYMKAKIIVE